MTRTLEEILAYSRETGMDWALTAEESGLLRREVERQAAEIARLDALRAAANNVAACDWSANLSQTHIHYMATLRETLRDLARLKGAE